LNHFLNHAREPYCSGFEKPHFSEPIPSLEELAHDDQALVGKAALIQFVMHVWRRSLCKYTQTPAPDVQANSRTLLPVP
jgi:hypothetical protein